VSTSLRCRIIVAPLPLDEPPIHLVLDRDYLHSHLGKSFSSAYQIEALISFTLQLILFIYAIIYPRVWTFALTGSIPPSRPRLTWEKSISYTNPGKLLQVSGIILLLLPFVASLEQYSWYNDMYWHGGVIYGGLGVLCVSQPTFGAILLVWGTVWRIKFGDGKPDGDEPTYVDIERGRVSRLVGAKSIAEEGQ